MPTLRLMRFLWIPIVATNAYAGCGVLADTTLGGLTASTLSGTYSIRKGILAMAKPDGVTAIAGNVIVGGGADQAILQWDANHQVADTASVTLIGPYPARLRMNGHSETLGPLVLSGDGDLSLGNDSAVVRFASSTTQSWTSGKRFLILDWNGASTGGGAEGLFFGSSATGLTPTQLAQVQFIDPAGFDPGTYSAALLATGEVVPTAGSAFDSWVGTGNGGKGLSGTDAALDADPDHDGIPNGIEFVIGGDPNPAHPGSHNDRLPTATDDGDHFVFTFTRMHEAAYLNPVVEFNTSLSGVWITAADPDNATLAIESGSLSDVVTVSIPKGNRASLFVRLKVSTQ